MREAIRESRSSLKSLLDKIEASDVSGGLLFEEAVECAVNIILDCKKSNGKLMVIGNGGSAAIASHIATDFWKNAKVKAMAFNDSVHLTCVSNDNGYEQVFEYGVNTFGESEDVLIAISSSGQSPNILRAAQAARDKGIKVITLSGFKQDNMLRALGDVNFYVPASHYGYVEVIHHSICHSFIDITIQQNNKTKNQSSLESEIV